MIATLGTAMVHGMQQDGDYLKVAACAKHFAVHSGPEAVRHTFDAEVSAKDLEETYLPLFQRNRICTKVQPQFKWQPAFSASAMESVAVSVILCVVWKSRIAQQSETK